ncbi:MAG: PKD domain-containing protein, partial [Acidobacteria bacterium]|nr:PKD domain-containing protein [Acidobacteriota bacterium]
MTLSGERSGEPFGVSETTYRTVSGREATTATFYGGRVIVWGDASDQHAPTRIYARVLSNTSETSSGTFRVSSKELDEEQKPAVAARQDGGFIVAWERLQSSPELPMVSVRLFDEKADPLGLDLDVSLSTGFRAHSPKLLSLANGGTLVAWVQERFESSLILGRVLGPQPILRDGFESGTTEFWTSTVPGPEVLFSATPAGGEPPLEVAFDASASVPGPDGAIIDYLWDFGDGDTGAGVAPVNLYDTEGSFEVILQVTDSLGRTNRASQTIPVAIVNDPPEAVFTATVSDRVLYAVTFDARSSLDPDGTIISYTWDFGDGATGTGNGAAHTYAGEGSYTVTLTVTDNEGAIDSAMLVIDVVTFNLPPDPIFLAQPSAGEAPLTVSFDASESTDPDGALTRFTWFFGDGASSSNAVADHLYSQPGYFQASLEVEDDEGAVSRRLFGITVNHPLPPTPVLEPLASPTNVASVTIAGETGPDLTVEIRGGDGLSAGQSDATGAFSIPVGLRQNSLNRLVVTVTDLDGRSSRPVAVDVIHDALPPQLFIDLPADGEQTIRDTATVAGRVGDLLSGSMGLDVTVDGQAANLVLGFGTNATFDLGNIPLALGDNLLEVVATDRVGNSVSKTVTITRTTPSGAYLVALSGDNQNAEAKTQLSNPLVLQVFGEMGQPLQDKLVTFAVVGSDGLLASSAGGVETRTLQLRADSSGQVAAWWTLGKDAGCANNRIRASSVGIEGSWLFTASASPAPASQINIGSGNNQRGEVLQQSVRPLEGWVSDGLNGVSGSPVTFTVRAGGGSVDGVSETTVPTDETGHARVAFTFGPDPGPQWIEADFPGNPGPPATFVLTGVQRNEGQPTTFEGLVLDNADQPIVGALCNLRSEGSAPMSETTDATGVCAFDNAPSGAVHLEVDGSVATFLGSEPIPAGSFPSLAYDKVFIPNAANRLGGPIRLPFLAPENERVYDGTQDVELTVDGIEGLRVTILAGSMTLADGTVPSPAEPVTVSLNQVHHDDIPMPIGNGAAPPFAWTLQPAGAHFDPPALVEYPNLAGLSPGAASYLLSFDHDTHRFEIIGSGSVSADGSTVVSDFGVGITKAGWGGICPPYPVTGDVSRCDPQGNGCGPSGSDFVSDLIPCAFKIDSGNEEVIVDVSQYCDDHDECYGTFFTLKLTCDLAFLSGLQDACDLHLRDDFFARLKCKTVAGVYFLGVDSLGGPSYLAGQVSNAWCRLVDFVFPDLGSNTGFGSLPLDSDQDALPDEWEIEVGLDPTDSSETFLDPDEDNLSNLWEFFANTDPFNPTAVPQTQ